MITTKIFRKRPSFLILALMLTGSFCLTASTLSVRYLACESGGIDTNENTEAFYLKRAAEYDRFGQPLVAERWLKDGVSLNPNSLALYNALGIRLIKSENFSDAERHLSRAYMKGITSTENGTLENNLAWSMMHSSKQSFVRKSFVANLAETALRKQPRSCEILHTNIVAQFSLSQEGKLATAAAFGRINALLSTYNSGCVERDSTWEVATENLSVVFIEQELTVSKATTKELQIAKAKLRDSFKGAHYAVSTVAIPQPQLKERFEKRLRDTRSAWWDYTTKQRDPFEKMVKTDAEQIDTLQAPDNTFESELLPIPTSF